MANTQIQTQTDFIVNLLRKGGKRKDVLAKYVKKWQNASERTFDRRLKLAEEVLASEHQAIKEKVEQKVLEKIDSLEIEIMSVIERKQILTQIARGEIPLKKPMVVDKGIQEIEVVPDWTDRKNAIAELNKMDGEYGATTKNIILNKGVSDFLLEE